MRHVITYAEFHGWLVYHTFDSRRSGAGFPDLFMVRGNRAVAIECKASKGRVTDDQRRWLQALGFAGVEAFAFWPDDEARVEALLR